jgi:diadenosine tetraphosphate (Ap4A) HIT family hydrolase
MGIVTKFYCGRTEAEDLRYQKRRAQQVGCPFCQIGDQSEDREILEENQAFWLIRADFPYAVFFGNEVVDHLLIVPKKHVEGIAGLTADERRVLIEMISRYEAKEYLFFGRSPNDSTKSVAHQHTHLIKTISPR